MIEKHTFTIEGQDGEMVFEFDPDTVLKLRLGDLVDLHKHYMSKLQWFDEINAVQESHEMRAMIRTLEEVAELLYKDK